jgi:hypothetical protein
MKYVYLILTLIFLINPTLQGKTIAEIGKDVDNIGNNKLGLEILSSLQQQLNNGKYADEIMDILNELDGDLYSDSIQDQQ